MSRNRSREIKFTTRQRVLMMVPLLLGSFIALINETLLSVAFPQMALSLREPISTIQWLATAYMLVIGISVPAVAFLMDSFTTRKLFLVAMLLFTLSTLGCGFSRSFPVLLVFRILQAIGTGMLVPIMTHTILAIFPIERRGTMMGIGMIVICSAPAIGPTVSGAILAHLEWNWLFFSMLPLALIAIIFGALSLKNVSRLTRPKIDFLSIGLSTMGFGALLYGMGCIETAGLRHPSVQGALALGLLGLVLFTRRQLYLEQPLLELRAFRRPMFSLGAVIIMIVFMIPFSTILILPIYMQGVLGITPFAAGLALMPGGIANGLSAFLAGNLYDRIGARGLVISGFALLAVAMFSLSRIGVETSLVWLMFLHVCVLIGVSFVNAPMQTNTLNQLPPDLNAHGVAITNSIMQIASAFGAAIFIGLMSAGQSRALAGLQEPGMAQQHMALAGGVNIAFRFCLLMILIGLVLSLFIKRRAPTEQQ